MARLSTHVLDTSRGKPAQDVMVDLHICASGERRHIRTVTTNADGRTDEPLLSGDRLETGVYELTFHAGDYFRRRGNRSFPIRRFSDDVVIRFGLADPAGNYHVPLLLSPYGYSTYRGS